MYVDVTKKVLRSFLSERHYGLITNTVKRKVLARHRLKAHELEGVGPVYKLKTTHGCLMYAAVNDFGVGYHIATAGQFEPHVSWAISEALNPGDVFLDVGAHIGHHTLLAAQAVGADGAVVAFEPDARNYALLEANVALNGYSQVSTFRRAVSDRNGELVISDVGDSHNHGHRVTAHTTEELNRHGVVRAGSLVDRVEAVALDAFELPVDRIDVVKMDIEGHEEFALLGMKKLLADHRPVIVMEYRRDQQRGLVDELCRNGYRCEIIRKNSTLEKLRDDNDGGMEHLDLKLSPQ